VPASPEPRSRILILGGTTEAAALAERLVADGRSDVVSSLVGATRRRRRLAGELRVGGFGGAGGLAAYLTAAEIGRVVDATHPFAATISAHAAMACARSGLPLLRLQRPAWRPRPGDRWIEVRDATAAAAALPGLADRVFLTIGGKEIAAFAGRPETWFLVRLIEAPAAPPPLPAHQLLLARGPFEVAEEGALLRRHAIGALVAKNSGGSATYAKIAAAREAALPVVMIARPGSPEGVATVADVDGALAWLALMD
jgi:precorrin-6A/cobalt-precorrin-6A reductase